MKTLSNFRAVYCSGFFIPDPAIISALSLLFEKVYLPNNIEFVKEFSKKYRIKLIATPKEEPASFDFPDFFTGKEEDPFEDLTREEQETARLYLDIGLNMVLRYAGLFPEVFESELFADSEPFEITLVKKGKPGNKNLYKGELKPFMLSMGDEETFPRLLSSGYVPVVGSVQPESVVTKQLDEISTKQLAALLGMKSVQMLFPQTKAVGPQVILEARERLSDHLPAFWSSMLKLTVNLKNMIRDCTTPKEVHFEAQEMVDTTIRPALIDLKNKMLKDKKNFFFKILSPVQKGLRLIAGNPILTQQQLLTSALLLGADVAMSTAENMRTIEALKEESGLTFLLEFEKIIKKSQKA